MAYPMGESKDGCLRVGFDRRLKLEFHVSKITSDAGLLAYRELDGALGLKEMAGSILTEARRGKNIQHLVEALFRQSVFGRLALPSHSRTQWALGRASGAPIGSAEAFDLRHAITLSVNAQLCYRLRCSTGVIWDILVQQALTFGMTHTRRIFSFLVLALGVAYSTPTYAVHSEDHRERQQLLYVGLGAAAAAVAVAMYIIIDGMSNKDFSDTDNQPDSLFLLPPSVKLDVIAFDREYVGSIENVTPMLRLRLSF